MAKQDDDISLDDLFKQARRHEHKQQEDEEETEEETSA